LGVEESSILNKLIVNNNSFDKGIYDKEVYDSFVKMNQLNENMAILNANMDIMIDNMNTMVTNMYNQNVAHQQQVNDISLKKIRVLDLSAKNYGLLDSEVLELKVYAVLLTVMFGIYYFIG